MACHEEYPHLWALHKKYQSKGFSVISVSSDEELAKASAFAKELKATFPVIHDPEFKLHDKFGVVPIPANVVIDRRGKIVASIEGADIKKLDTAVARAVGK